jgi:hypothetical protein
VDLGDLLASENVFRSSFDVFLEKINIAIEQRHDVQLWKEK